MAGRLYGEADFARDPHAKQKELMLTLLKQQAWQTYEEGEPVAPAIAPKTDASYRQVARVGTRIVLAARDFVEMEISAREARLEALAKGAARNSESERLVEEIGEWRERLRLLKGSWNYIVVKSPVPNAFVSDLSPRNIFVNEGLVTGLKITDDELALVLGHEMSHLLHGHMSERLTNAFVVNLVQLVLLNLLDPFGVSTIFAAGLLAKFASFEQASHSRHNETEADVTGLRIAALACFDTQSAPVVFGKLAEMERKARLKAGDTTQRVAGWGDTHPMPKDREGSLIAMSKSVNKEALGNCNVLRKKFNMLGLDVHF
jgi:Zn-dependent protease with chaperone function